MLMLPPVPHLENKLLFDCHRIKADMEFVKCFITSEIRKKISIHPENVNPVIFGKKLRMYPINGKNLLRSIERVP